MLRIHFAGMLTAIITSALAVPTQAQQPAPPPFATTKVTDNVYIFRYGGDQSMFILAPSGVGTPGPPRARGAAQPHMFPPPAITEPPTPHLFLNPPPFLHTPPP